MRASATLVEPLRARGIPVIYYMPGGVLELWPHAALTDVLNEFPI